MLSLILINQKRSVKFFGVLGTKKLFPILNVSSIVMAHNTLFDYNFWDLSYVYSITMV